ncbi:peptide MFS transporter [Bacteroidetes bacterium endosymbiont of Geopemphigus sp.]|uniref:peptide MFS transporter n=1 Tax=Bacteroidetes bacterium endosymbiont of Geopemphigus sp. TaxID=2047937 RepID=UPI000CD1FB70|nr:peptide MFS transporter [Bacteroidetes bacterium endosymbiont of Geopemphigus sp.]
MSKHKKHSKGLYLLFFTEIWERFSYYGMRGILILYLSKSLIEGGLGISLGTASLIYGYFTGFVYFTPLLGGCLADTYIGQRKSITIGGIMMMAGQLALFAFNTHWGLFLGLSLLILGNGFFKPNISTIVGQLYENQPERKDSAFSIFYMGINLGAFIAPLIIGYVAEDLFALKGADGQILNFGYKYGFLISAIGMFLGQISYNILAKKYLGDTGMRASRRDPKKKLQNKTPLTKMEKDRIKTIFIFSFISIFFWAAFEQAGSSLTLYTDQFIEKKIEIGSWNWHIPTSWFQSINALFIVMLAPVFAAFWESPFGQKFSTPIKMGIAMLLVGIGFLFMVGAVFERGNDNTHASVKASVLWIIFTYLFHTLGELCLSPVGLSMVTKLSPAKLASLLMGTWLFSSFIANIAGGYIAAYVHELGAKNIFTLVALFCFFIGGITLIFSERISKKMHGIK